MCMKSFRSKPGLSWGIVVVCLLACVFPAHGQLSTLKKAVESGETAKPAPAEKPEDARKRLEQWHHEAREALARAETTPPEGITPAEVDERRRILEQIALTATRSLKNLNAKADALRELEAARAENAAWTGFKESPPYSVLTIDELLNERDAVKSKLTSYKSSLANIERVQATTVAETKAAEEAVNAAIIAAQDAETANVDAAKWRLETARANARMLIARAGSMQNAMEVLKHRIATAEADISLLDRKVKIASANSRFGDEDLAKLAKISAERKSALQKEIAAVSKRLKTDIAARNKAQATLDELVADETSVGEPDGLPLAKFRLEVAESRVDATQTLIEGLESLIQAENLRLKAYQDRRQFIEARTPDERAKALESMSVYAENLRVWASVTNNEIDRCGADLSKIESRAAAITSDDPRFALINEQRAAKSEKLAMLQRVSQAVSSERRLLKRWIAEYAPKPGEMSFFERVSAFSENAWNRLKKLWALELTSYQKSIEVDGETITGRIPVTLGTLLRALLFFFVGYWIAARIANRIQAGVVRRGHIAEAQARTLRNWSMIVVGVFLILGTLAFLDIPPTVFAFLGGALAIGLGFGLQTLIKNFISGIIVLVERKVRVGDILDVDGIVGTVVEVNTRSSVIRSPDDVETMIPNSLFLENRVTNWTLSSAKMRRKVTVGVAYGTDPRMVMDILTESAGRHGNICKDPAPFAVFDDFGDNALIFSLYFWVDMRTAGNAMVIASDVRLMIEKRFSEVGIGIPFPQRDMHLTTEQPIKVEISNPQP